LCVNLIFEIFKENYTMPDKKDRSIDELKQFFATRLKKIREDRGYTQPELAKLIGTTDRNISNYETGYSFPSIKVLYEISRTLKVSVDYLLGITNNPEINEPSELISSSEKKLLDTLSHNENFYQLLLKDPEKMTDRIYRTWNLIREIDEQE